MLAIGGRVMLNVVMNGIRLVLCLLLVNFNVSSLFRATALFIYMYMYMYVCMYVCMCACICTYKLFQMS